MLTRRKVNLLEVLADAVRNMCEGEIEQALCANSGDVTRRPFLSPKNRTSDGGMLQDGTPAGALETHVKEMRNMV